MNPDYIIGSNNPHILYADYSGGRRAGAPLATPIAYESGPPVADNTDPPEASGAVAVARSAEQARPENTSRTERVAQNNKGAPEVQDHDLSFGDILDILNPLQHIPIISQIYRAVTGDTISGFAEVAGGALYGGPIGLVGGVIEAAAQQVTGQGAGETFVADILGIKQKTGMETQMASADSPPADDESLDTQVASAIAAPGSEEQEELPKLATSSPPSHKDRLETQVAQGMLPPVAPRTELAQAEAPLRPEATGPRPQESKAPYGGVMQVAGTSAASHETTASTNDNPEASGLGPVASSPIPVSILPHAPAMMDGRKVYSLAGVRRMSATANIPMPANPGPDVRLKPVTRQAAAPQGNKGVMAPINPPAAEAQKILGLSKPTAPVAELQDTPSPMPGDADLLPSGGGSDPLPTALIEDMMRMGLDKYQKGLNNGTLQTAPQVDVRG